MMRRTTAALAAALVFAAGCGGGEEVAPEEPAAAATAATTAAPATTTPPPATTADHCAGLDNDECICLHLAAELGYENCADYQADMAARQAAADAAREVEAEEVCESLWDPELLGAAQVIREQECLELGGEWPYAPGAEAEPGPDPEPEAADDPGAGPDTAGPALAVQAPVTTEAVDYPYPDAPEGDYADEAPPAPEFAGPGLPAQVGETVERGVLDLVGSPITWPLAADPPDAIRKEMAVYGDTEIGAGRVIVVGTVSTWRFSDDYLDRKSAYAPAAGDRRPEDYTVKRVVTSIDDSGSIAAVWMCSVPPEWHRRLRTELYGDEFGPSGGEMIFDQAYIGGDGLYYPTNSGGSGGLC